MNNLSFRLKTLQVLCGMNMTRTSAITLQDQDGNETPGFAEGVGPISATYHAINRAIESIPGLEDSKIELTDFWIKTEGEGFDAQGKASVTVVGFGDPEEHYGSGRSPDIVEASTIAYVEAVNKLLAAQGD